ncbi:MAG: RimK family alpha-L-glutamate ligase [Candidatus Uhrbacteria bacterium]|nr:RimK family alpha-L-glutamate ligase [Candidatus Uhrbacteria bacterium]
MRIGILTFVFGKKQIAIGTRMIMNEARSRGHEVTILYAGQVGLVFGNGKTITYKGKPIGKDDFDVILVRPGFTADPSVNASVIKQFQLAGFYVINSYIGVFRAKNKIRTLQMLDHFGIPVPKTHVLGDVAMLEAAAQEFTFPVIIKTIFGTHGTGVFIAESLRSLAPIVDYLTKKERGPVKLQEYIEEADGKDLRVFVTGKRIIAAMERQAKTGEFRANFHQGGSVGPVDLTDEEKKLAIKATLILGLDMAGVDILRTKKGPKIIEVNSNPGLEGISKATGINVAAGVVDFIERRTQKNHNKKPLTKKKMTE